MKAKKSPLKFLDFAIMNSFFETIFPDSNSKCNFEEIPIDIDFETIIDKEKPNLFNIALNLNGNTTDKPMPGYKFSIIAEGIFELEGYEELEKQKVDQFLLYSAIPMLISSIRNYLLNISSYAPFGKYLLPAIDLKDLIKKKIEQQEKQNKEKEGE